MFRRILTLALLAAPAFAADWVEYRSGPIHIFSDAADHAGDLYESLYGSTGRNTFRAPFQVRFDMTVGKEFTLNDRFRLRFNADAFNIFNHPDFDAPNNDVTFFRDFSGPPSIPPKGSLGIIQHTIGSSRFLQLSLHLRF